MLQVCNHTLIAYPESEILGTMVFLDAPKELWDQCITLGIEYSTIVMPAVGSTQSGYYLECDSWVEKPRSLVLVG